MIKNFFNNKIKNVFQVFLLTFCLAQTPTETTGESVAGLPGFDWQQSHSRVMSTGELEHAPEPFAFTSGISARYIDFEGGDDKNDGSRDRPWKHHPWDPNSQALSRAAARDVHTYVFKSGVVYRGCFVIPEGAGGTSENALVLTRDPDWGSGEAVISGSEMVTGWRKQAHPAMPDSEKIWMAEVDFLPRNIWMVEEKNEPVRLTLARSPNWRESDANDPMSEWPVWDQPEWWKDRNKTKLDNVSKHVGIAASLPRPLEKLVGGTVWTEWGIVMGSPYPALIEGVDAEKDGIIFRGPWTYEALEKIITGNRYHLENLPQFLDEPGEFWVEKTGADSARIYLRLPEDRDPNTVVIEAASRHNFFEGKNIGTIHWSGLTFRFGNVGWDYNHPRWARPNLMVAAISINGSAEEIKITHNSFENLPMAARITVGGAGHRIGRVTIADNIVRHTDHGAFVVENFASGDKPVMGYLGHVDFLRNRLEDIGMRILSGEHGHAVDIRYPQTSHVAGNFLRRIAGWGLAVFGGKPSGAVYAAMEAPLSRHLLHHNRVEDVLLKSNDWGGIETWQGGSFYVFNNIVINAIGFKNWIFSQGNKDNPGSFGHAYYMDGSFKNYVFNNIGLGRNNTVGTKGVNLTAIQNIISFENWYFNNSFHRFVVATRQQSPEAGRFRYLGNAFSDVSQMLYRHADPKNTSPDPNAEHYTQGGQFDYKTLAYRSNFIHELRGDVGTFEETGVVYENPEQFSEALQRLHAQAAEAVTVVDEKIFSNPDEMDWQPTAALGKQEGVKIFVPWALARTVGEWTFTQNIADPNEVIDEHWFMSAGYAERENYKNQPRRPLMGEGFTAENYIEGALENWTHGALRFDGKKHFLRASGANRPRNAKDTEQQQEKQEKTVELPFGKATVPNSVPIGGEIVVDVELTEAVDPSTLHMHLHWMRANSWGGFAALAGGPQKLGANRYRFAVEAVNKNDLAAYSVLLFLSPDGNWDKRSAEAQIRVERESGFRLKDVPQRGLDADDTGLILEAYFRTRDSEGILVQKMQNGHGYRLAISNGKPFFAISDGIQNFEVSADNPVDGGDWRHLLAEFDRSADRSAMRLYLDGELFAEKKLESVADRFGNEGEFFVGGSPDGGEKEMLAMDLDFLRVALTSLAESRTSIQELYSWQFDGPHLRDFAGKDRSVKNNPGALVK